MTPEHWYLLPVGCGIAVLAMSSGVSAGNFWVPVYLLWSTFEPPLAFWMTLATMLCGYGSGVARNLWQGTIDRGVIIRYLPLTVPAALVGGYLAPALNVSWLILLFGIFVLGYGMRLLGQAAQSSGKVQSSALSNRPTLITSPTEGRGCMRGESTKILLGADKGGGAKTRLGPTVMGSGIILLGGLGLGLITVGLGEIMLPRLLVKRKSLSPAAIVGSTVVVIFVTSLAAALVRLNGPFLAALSEQRATLMGALLFAGPGVILGGQLGPMLARHLKARALRWYVAIILLLVGLLMLWRFTVSVAFER
jgi:uncharacterized membrane protein YfcA